MEENAMHIEFVADTSALTGNGHASRVDADGIRRFAAVAEETGYDRVRIAGLADGHDATVLASYILHTTSHLGVLTAHDASLVAPEIAAQQIATLDRLSRGRLAIGITPGEAGAHGHEERPGRLDEYLGLLKRLWSNDKPFDYEGKYYRANGAFAPAKPHNDSRVPISLTGLSGTAIKVAARHADIFALPPSTIAGTRLTIERVRAASACHRRADAIRFSYPLRAIVAPTKAEAWAMAEQLLGRSARPAPATQPRAAWNWNDADRMRNLAADNFVRTAETGSEEAALIAGTPEQVALAILDHYGAGISDFVPHGFSSDEEAALFGREVIPLVRNASRHRVAHAGEIAPVMQLPLRHLPWRRFSA